MQGGGGSEYDLTLTLLLPPLAEKTTLHFGVIQNVEFTYKSYTRGGG